MTLDDLLEKLGYKGSPQFLRRGDGRFESEPGLGHIFRRGEDKNEDVQKRRWRVEGVYGLRDTNQNSERLLKDWKPKHPDFISGIKEIINQKSDCK
jgi:hypothetical protein